MTLMPGRCIDGTSNSSPLWGRCYAISQLHCGTRFMVSCRRSSIARTGGPHEELGRLLDLAKSSRLILIDLIGRNGLRPTKARAVRRRDIDLELAELSVTGQQNKQNQRSKVKTKRSVRPIHLDDVTLARLRTWRAHKTSSARKLTAPGKISTFSHQLHKEHQLTVIALPARSEPSQRKPDSTLRSRHTNCVTQQSARKQTLDTTVGKSPTGPGPPKQ